MYVIEGSTQKKKWKKTPTTYL